MLTPDSPAALWGEHPICLVSGTDVELKMILPARQGRSGFPEEGQNYWVKDAKLTKDLKTVEAAVGEG
jgi:hypothetical protein